MQLHQLIHSKNTKRQRIGRGGKRGTYSGRGQKGQKSRAGRRIRPAVRDLILRLPKRRGFRNKPTSPKPFVLNLKKLVFRMRPFLEKDKKFTITINESLLKKIAIVPLKYNGKIKILGDGDIDFPVVVEKLLVSKDARQKIEKAGGRVCEKIENKKQKVELK